MGSGGEDAKIFRETRRGPSTPLLFLCGPCGFAVRPLWFANAAGGQGAPHPWPLRDEIPHGVPFFLQLIDGRIDPALAE